MILVDTSVWIDHLARGDAGLVRALDEAVVLVHPFVVGEIACGNLRNRARLLALLNSLPVAVVAEASEVLGYIERRQLYGSGIGYINVHLLASVALTAHATVWTRDRRLHAVASELGCAHVSPAGPGLTRRAT